ncbi:MAG: DeoR/GlpR transcriptional regulator [Clostridia bacterium]|nr:DeoR/GlpR transcriptional regulator [Clostridia bacterium]
MSQKRIDTILNIIKEQGYVTVRYLCDQLHYSTATINRDLNDLQRQKRIIRHYGGAELAEEKGTPLVFRYHKMRPVKRLIAEKATTLVQDGMTVFIDGSTTTQCMGPYLKGRRDLTVITNNLNLASHLSETDIRCICLGGTIIEPPDMIGGSETVRQLRSYTADLAFFSTGGLSADGKVYESDAYYDLRRTMVENAKKSVFLVDHQKINTRLDRVLCDLSDIAVVITDWTVPNTVKTAFADTCFIQVETPKTQR